MPKQIEEACVVCETCKHFYECDNMGFYTECLPKMEYYEKKEEESL